MSNNSYSHKTINGMKKSVHRHVMEEHLGRQLEQDEHVYHVNGDSKDNRIDNLVVVKKTYNKPLKERKKTSYQVLKEHVEKLEKRIKNLEKSFTNG